MNQEAKFFIAVGIATIAIIVGGVFFLNKSSTSLSPVNQEILVRSDSNKIGNPSAKVALVEFGDYQCPACGRVNAITKRITEEYKDKILFVFRHFPLPTHPNALVAAEAVEVAGAQGKFWGMHDMIYDNQDEWSDSDKALDIFFEYAKDLGLDVEKFKQDVQSNKFADKIQKDKNDGNALGVNSTPTFYLNGLRLEGVLSYEDLKNKIGQLL